MISEEREDSEGAKAASQKKKEEKTKKSEADDKLLPPTTEEQSIDSNNSIVHVPNNAGTSAQPLTVMDAMEREAMDIETAKYLTRSTIQKMQDKVFIAHCCAL